MKVLLASAEQKSMADTSKLSQEHKKMTLELVFADWVNV